MPPPNGARAPGTAFSRRPKHTPPGPLSSRLWRTGRGSGRVPPAERRPGIAQSAWFATLIARACAVIRRGPRVWCMCLREECAGSIPAAYDRREGREIMKRLLLGVFCCAVLVTAAGCVSTKFTEQAKRDAARQAAEKNAPTATKPATTTATTAKPATTPSTSTTSSTPATATTPAQSTATPQPAQTAAASASTPAATVSPRPLRPLQPRRPLLRRHPRPCRRARTSPPQRPRPRQCLLRQCLLRRCLHRCRQRRLRRHPHSRSRPHPLPCRATR